MKFERVSKYPDAVLPVSALLDCLEEAVRCMAAVTALFFGLTVAGVTALMLIGGG